MSIMSSFHDVMSNNFLSNKDYFLLYTPPPPPLRGRTLQDTIGDKDVERLIVKNSAEEFKTKTEPSVLLGREVGNMYCASLYGGVASLLAK